MKDDGGPAFPPRTDADYHQGMTLRDWFAGMAVQYYCKEYVGHPDAIAKMAFKLADSMLAARKEGQ